MLDKLEDGKILTRLKIQSSSIAWTSQRILKIWWLTCDAKTRKTYWTQVETDASYLCSADIFRLWNTKRLSIDKVRGKLFENLYQKCGFKAELLNLLKCWSAFTDKFSLKCTTAIILPYVINVPRTLHCRSSERFSDRSLGPVSFQGSSVSYPVLNSCPSSVSVTWCDILKSWTLQAFAKLFLTNC